VPLDNDVDDGWSEQAGRLALPLAVCDKLRTGLVAGVVVSTTCATKTNANPPCGAWSSVLPANDAGVAPAPDAARPPPMPSLLTGVMPEGGAASPCCPLMADDTKLYTCLCDTSSVVKVVAIDATAGSVTDVTSFTPQRPVRALRYETVLAVGAVPAISTTMRTCLRTRITSTRSRTT
jgi:hypothetical protein